MGGVTADRTGQLRTFVERYLAAWNGGVEEALEELVTADVVWSDPALAAPARGVAAVQAFMRSSRRTFPDLRFCEPDPPRLWSSGEEVAWAWTMQGTMLGDAEPAGFAATGRRMQVEGIDAWTLRDGRIARYRAFYDMSDLARQLGLAPAAGSRAEGVAVALQRLQARLRRHGA